MLEQAMHERGMRSRWPTNRVANALNTRSGAADETCHERTKLLAFSNAKVQLQDFP